MSNDKPRIGFIGLGLMGHGIAKNLVSKGFPLTLRVHRNRKPAEDILAAGAKEAKTNAEVARASDIVILCVTGSPQIEEIVYGENSILGVARQGLIVIDTSTAEPTSTAKIRGDLAPKGTLYVDAPLARTPKEAEEGRLNTMVGADDGLAGKFVQSAGEPFGHLPAVHEEDGAVSLADELQQAGMDGVPDRNSSGRLRSRPTGDFLKRREARHILSRNFNSEL